MLERQLEMDRLKSQTEDLGRRKPAIPGMDSVQMQVADLSMFLSTYILLLFFKPICMVNVT